MTIVIDAQGMLATAGVLGLLTALCWWKVWYKPGEHWDKWAVAACIGMLFTGAALIAYAHL